MICRSPCLPSTHSGSCPQMKSPLSPRQGPVQGWRRDSESLRGVKAQRIAEYHRMDSTSSWHVGGFVHPLGRRKRQVDRKGDCFQGRRGARGHSDGSPLMRIYSLLVTTNSQPPSNSEIFAGGCPSYPRVQGCHARIRDRPP